MTENLAIKTKGLTKSYGKIQALHGVDLRVERGQIYGFLGPNGAGKTTTIRCMLDLIRPQSGEVEILGINPQEDPVAVRAKVGYLPGELSTEANLRVDGQLRYFAELRGNQIEKDFMRDLAKRLQLDLKMPIKNLSKGNKQKVGVVQALMHKPDLLLMDEPTSGLDPLMQQEVYKMIREANAAGTTVFFSSHIITEVEALAERVAIIRGGLIVEEEKPENLMSMEYRNIRVRFSKEVDPAPLGNVPGVTMSNGSTSLVAELQVEGEMDGLIKALSKFPVSDLDIDRPSLEEIFLAYYKEAN